MAEQPRSHTQGSSVRHPVGNKPVNLNTAGREELMSVRGIGPGRADEILAHRARNGPFTSVSDLQQLNLLTPAEMASLRDQLTV